MLEKEMYPLFRSWLKDNTDVFMQEPLIPATCCFDFIAVKGEHVVVYELKLSNAKKVIRQANMALLWCDHSYAVLPKSKIHLGLKYRELLCEGAGLMSLDMKNGEVIVYIEPETNNSWITIKRVKLSMVRWIIENAINDHQDFIALWKKRSFASRLKESKTRSMSMKRKLLD